MLQKPKRADAMKKIFNGASGDKNLRKLVRLLARQAAECDYEAAQETRITPNLEGT